ncbi:cullin-4A [Trichonephila clavipes]|nr:cullin-4A [Trichonephila clavipes]
MVSGNKNNNDSPPSNNNNNNRSERQSTPRASPSNEINTSDDFQDIIDLFKIGLGSNPGEGMDVCKCIEPLRYGGCTLNSRRTASPLVRLMEGEERWEAPDPSQGVLPQNWGETEPNCTATCTVLKATANDRRTSSLLLDDFPGPGYDAVEIRWHEKQQTKIAYVIPIRTSCS